MQTSPHKQMSKLIPAAVLSQCMQLSVVQVQAAMRHGGAEVKLHTAEFLGMMPGGAFVYACTGEYFQAKYTSPDPGCSHKELVPHTWPSYLGTFKVKLAQDKKPGDAERMLADGWVVCWGS